MGWNLDGDQVINVINLHAIYFWWDAFFLIPDHRKKNASYPFTVLGPNDFAFRARNRCSDSWTIRSTYLQQVGNKSHCGFRMFQIIRWKYRKCSLPKTKWCQTLQSSAHLSLHIGRRIAEDKKPRRFNSCKRHESIGGTVGPCPKEMCKMSLSEYHATWVIGPFSLFKWACYVNHLVIHRL